MAVAQTIHGLFLPKKFFITSGSATSSVSPLNAFDAALVKARIAQCNIVCVSSILPPDAEMVQNEDITPGTITFAVVAHMSGNPGETIGAGIGWVWGKTSMGQRYGLVSEVHGYKDREVVERELKSKLREMAKIRELNIEEMQLKVEHMEVPKGKYGSVVVALVYVPWTGEESLGSRQLSSQTTSFN